MGVATAAPIVVSAALRGSAAVVSAQPRTRQGVVDLGNMMRMRMAGMVVPANPVRVVRG